MGRRRRRAKLKVAGTPEEIARAREEQEGPMVPRQPTAPPQVSRANAIAGLFGTPATLGGTSMTPGQFSKRGPRYRRALRQLSPEATFDTGLGATPSPTRPLQWRGRHDVTRPEVVQHYRELYAQPGATGIEKERNLALSRAAAAEGPAPQVLRPLRKEEQRGIQEALDSARGDPAKLQKTIESLDRTFSPESLRAVPGYTAYKTRETAGVQLESDDDRRIRHLTESKFLLDRVQGLIDAGDEGGAQMTLEGLDLETLNPRIRGQVEEVLQSTILSPTQKLEEVRKAVRFGTTGKKTPAEEEEEAERKLAEGERKAEEKEQAAEQKELKSAEADVVKRRESRAKENLTGLQRRIDRLDKEGERLRDKLAKDTTEAEAGSGKEMPSGRRAQMSSRLKEIDKKIADLQGDEGRIQAEYDDAASATDRLLAGRLAPEEIPPGPGGEDGAGEPTATASEAPPGADGPGWTYKRGDDGTEIWRSPDGTRYVRQADGEKVHFPPGSKNGKGGWPSPTTEQTMPKSSLVKGKVYTNAEGKRARWNGKGFEPLNG